MRKILYYIYFPIPLQSSFLEEHSLVSYTAVCPKTRAPHKMFRYFNCSNTWLGWGGTSGLVSCTAVCPIPVQSPVHWLPTLSTRVSISSGRSKAFALPPPPPRLLSLARPDPGYILTRHGLTLAMSRTGQDRGRLQDFRSTIQIFQVSKKAHYRKNACLHLEDFVHVYFTICQSLGPS